VGGHPVGDQVHQFRAGAQVPVGIERVHMPQVGGQSGDPRINIDAPPMRINQTIYRESVPVMWNST
jgi:hypothetical protein